MQRPDYKTMSVTQLTALQNQGAVEYDEGTFQLVGDPSAGFGGVWWQESSLSVPSGAYTTSETYNRAEIDASLSAKLDEVTFNNLVPTLSTDAERNALNVALQAQIDAKPGKAIVSILPVGTVWPKTITWSDATTTQLEQPVVATIGQWADAVVAKGQPGYQDAGVLTPEDFDNRLDYRQTRTLYSNGTTTFNPFIEIENFRQRIRYTIVATSPDAITPFQFEPDQANPTYSAKVTFGQSSPATVAVGNGPTINLPPKSVTYFEYDGKSVEMVVTKFERFQRFATTPPGPIPVAFDTLVYVADQGKGYANETGETEAFSGVETDNWKVVFEKPGRVAPDVWIPSTEYMTGDRVVAIAPAGTYGGKPRIYEADAGRPDTVAAFDATEAGNWTDKGGAPLIEHATIYPIIPLSGSSVDGLNRKAQVPVFFTSIGEPSNVKLTLMCNTSGSKIVKLDGQTIPKTGDLTSVVFDGPGYLIMVTRDYDDPTASVGGSTRIVQVIKPGTQEVLPDWGANQAYTAAETKVVGIAPIGVAPQVEGAAYILRPKADLTSGATLDATEWALYDVLGAYKLNGTTVRSVTDTGVESLLFFDINAGTEGNIRIIPKDITKTFRLSGIADANFALDNNTVGQVTATGGTSQDVTVVGPATLYHTLDGTTHKISVFGSGLVATEDNELHYAKAAIGSQSSGRANHASVVYLPAKSQPNDNRITISGQNITVKRGTWEIESHILANDVSTTSNSFQIARVAGTATMVAVNGGIQATDGNVWRATSTPAKAIVEVTSDDAIFRVQGLNSSLSLYSYGSHTVVKEVIKYRTPQEYVRKSEVLEVEDSLVTLIDVDATDNTLYPFSTGETWAEIKANYELLIFTGNTSQISVNNVRPYSKILTPSNVQDIADNGGGLVRLEDSLNSVDVWINNPQDSHTGFTYQQSNGDAPTSGRMSFTVIGIRKQKTVIGIPVINPDVADGTYQIRKNADGTFELV